MSRGAPRLLLEATADDPFAVVRSRFWQFNAIGFFSAGEACVVDPGMDPAEIEALARVVTTASLPRGAAPRRVTRVAITHSHHDHIRGWMHFPGARVSMPRVAAQKDESARERILASKRAIDGRLGVDAPHFTYPRADDVFDERLAFTVGELDVEMRFLPGHSNDTSVVLVPSRSTLCTADYLVHPGLPYCRFEAGLFERALRTLAAWVVEEGVERILPAHQAPILGRAAILAAIEEQASYFRFLREHVRGALAAGQEGETIVRSAAAALQERRGVDLGPAARQDSDNARRVLAEESVLAS